MGMTEVANSESESERPILSFSFSFCFFFFLLVSISPLFFAYVTGSRVYGGDEKLFAGFGKR